VAGADRMTIEEVVRKVLLDEHADVIREAVRAVAAELMELEVSELIGAEHWPTSLLKRSSGWVERTAIRRDQGATRSLRRRTCAARSP
jgi:transposase-like protein